MKDRNKLILIALVASVAVNLVFIGGIGYRTSNTREFGTRPFPPNVGWVVRDLSEERRIELEPLLEQSYSEIRPIRREMGQAQRRVNELMASDTFDAQALGQAFTALREANERYQSLSHQQTITLLNELSEEERQIAQKFVQRRGPRDGADRSRGRNGRPGFRPGRPAGPPDGPGQPPFRPDRPEPPPPPRNPDQ